MTLADDRWRLVRILAVGVVGGLTAVCLWLRGDAAGADAFAVREAARTFLAGGDPYRPVSAIWPYAYAPWLLPVFVPFAILPWTIAWPAWRIAMLAFVAWTWAWAYERRPNVAAAVWVGMAIPLGLVLDSGNAVVLCIMAVWAAQRAEPRLAGLLWAFATSLKWFPAAFLPILPARARRWGLALVGLGILLSVLTWPWTLEQLAVVARTGAPGTSSIFRLRIDHLAILWAAIPWLWERVLPSLERRHGRSVVPPRGRLAPTPRGTPTFSGR